MAGQDVRLHIVGKQWEAEDSPQEITVTTQGRLYRRANETVLTYRESEDSGMGLTRTTLKILADGGIHLLRTGETQSKMEFVAGDRHMTQMTTPLGLLQMGFYTHEAKAELGDERGDIRIRYSLDYSNQDSVNISLHVEYERLNGLND